MRRALATLFVWFTVSILSMHLGGLMLAVQGRFWLIPRVLSPIDWCLLLLLGYLVGYRVSRYWHGRRRIREVTNRTLALLVRFWHNWRTVRISENSFRYDELDWTIRVTDPSGTASHSDASGKAMEPVPAFRIEPVPHCPKCGLPAAERRQSSAWHRSCLSAACNWHQLSRDSLAETADALTRAAREAWMISRGEDSRPGSA